MKDNEKVIHLADKGHSAKGRTDIFYKLGYFLGRYVDLDVRVEERFGRLTLRTSQNLDIVQIIEDLQSIGGNRGS